MRDIAGATLGVVGYGRIGRELAELGRAAGMQVLAHDPYVEEASTPLETVFENADVVSLHVPLDDSTRGLVGPDLLARAKPGPDPRQHRPRRSHLLARRPARGAGERPARRRRPRRLRGRTARPEQPLFDHPRVLVSPHALGLTRASREAVFRMMAEGVAAVLRGEQAQHVA